jgi:uncharacterized membrane protein
MDDKRAIKRLGLIMGVYVVVFGWMTVERHWRGKTSIFDLGIFDQAVYLMSQGDSFFLTTRGLHIQADHFQPILYLVAPVYLLWSSPVALLLFQTVVIALGAYPVYLVSRHHGLSGHWALLLSGAYLAQPIVMFLNRFDFHPVAVMMTSLMFAVAFVELDKPVHYACAIVLALGCTEAAGFTVIALAVTVFMIRGFRWGAATMGLGLLGLVVARGTLDYFNGEVSSPYKLLYSDFGDSELEVLYHLLSQPLDSLTQLATAANAQYLFYLFAPLVFLPLIRPERLIPLVPVLLGNLLSWRESQHRIENQYGAGIAPFLMWAAIVAWAQLRDRKVAERWLGGFLGLGILLSLFFGPVGPNKLRRLGPRQDVQKFLTQISPTDRLSTDLFLGSKVAQREQIFLFPNPFVRVAWGNDAPALLHQTVREYRPLTRGMVRRGLESTNIDKIFLGTEQRLGFFPLREVDDWLCRQEIGRSASFRLVEEDRSTRLWERVRRP